MAKYLGPKVKIIRKFGILPGLTNKQIKNRKKTLGQHGKLFLAKSKQLSLSDDYNQKLQEKQKLHYNYGISEKQLIKYYNIAKKNKNSTGKIFLELIESRLDCIVYRLGFASTIPKARQMINHGHILINNKKVNIASFQCKKNDIITINNNYLMNHINEISQNTLNLQDNTLKTNTIKYKFGNNIPSHLEVINFTGKVLSPVKSNEILLDIDELKIIEYYSR